MTLITRGTKSTGGTDFAPNGDMLAEEFNADSNNIVNDYNGNITNANCSPSMGLEGTKLADAPNGVPTAKINNAAVTDTKLASSASADSGRAVGADHVKTQAIAGNKFKSTLGLIHEVAFGYTDPIPIGGIRLTVNPSLSYPVANYHLIGLFIKNVTLSSASLSLTCRANSTGANWAGAVDVINAIDLENPTDVSGTLVYVFIEKT